MPRSKALHRLVSRDQRLPTYLSKAATTRASLPTRGSPPFTRPFTPLFSHLFTPIFSHLFTPIFTPLFNPIFSSRFTVDGTRFTLDRTRFTLDCTRCHHPFLSSRRSSATLNPASAHTMQKPEPPQDVMADDWFAYKLAPDGDVEDGCHPDEAQALKDYLRRKTTAPDAARAITRPLVTCDDPREDLVRLWALLMDAFVELPSEHMERLIALVAAIEALPEPDFRAVDADKQPQEKLWKGLAGFGHLWADSYQSGSWRAFASNLVGEERKAYGDEHIQKAQAEARLIAAGLAGIEIDWAYEAVADALESSNALLDMEIPAAAQWLQHCGQRLRQGAAKGEKSWALEPRISNASCTPSRDLWEARSDGVMNGKRWETWQERLRTLQGEGGRVGEAAKRGLQAMEAVGV